MGLGLGCAVDLEFGDSRRCHPGPDSATSESAVSRRFVALTETALAKSAGSVATVLTPALDVATLAEVNARLVVADAADEEASTTVFRLSGRSLLLSRCCSPCLGRDSTLGSG